MQVFQQVEVGVGVLVELKLLERYDKIQVAVSGIEIRAGGRAEQFDREESAIPFAFRSS